MKVFIEASVLTTSHLSGVGHVLLSTLQSWDINNKDKLVLVVPYDKFTDLRKWNLQFEIKKLYIPSHLFRALRKWNLFPWMDIFLGRGIYIFPNYWNWPLLLSRSVTYFHDLGYLTHPEYIEEKNRKFLARNATSWLKRSNRVAAVSEFTAKELLQYYPWLEGRVSVVPNGVKNVDHQSPEDRDRQIVSQKFNIKGNYLLYVGNIEPRKNLLSLLEAYEKLPKRIRNTQALILVGGDGWRNEEILTRIAHLRKNGENVQKISQSVSDNDLPALYRNASAVMLVSSYEGFGMTPLEAMSFGTPVIVSDIPAIREVVDDAGLYVNPNKIQDISDKIGTLVSDEKLRSRMITLGYTRANQFSWKRSVTELNSCLDMIKEKHQ